MKPETENWLKIARYDLKAAKGNYQIELYLKVFENCHAALEKLLKGIINEKEEPPKIHNLLKLCSKALIDDLQKDVKSTLDDLNNVYISTRYPKNFDEINSYLSKERTEETLRQTERIFKWLEKKII